jgi:predicted lipoprotein with Yx(FWY)xxD motif
MRKITRFTGLAAAALTMVAVAACGSSSSSTTSAASSSTPAAGSTATASPASGSSGTTLKTTTIDGTQVITNSAGMTLYWFVVDTSTKSNCTGSCASYWTPVTGPATAGSGVTGTLGVITRSGGTKQATYDGHPLYTYVGDTAPGQNNGNGKNLSGGLWWEMTVSGAKPASASTSAPTSTSTSTGGGYGY